MIKLIASDIDGTLVEEGSSSVNPELFDVIRKLKEQGRIVAFASGRQYNSMCRLMEPVKDDVIFIAENGAYVVCRDKTIDCIGFERALYEEIIWYLRSRHCGSILANAPRMAYIESKDPEFLRWMREGYRIEMEQAEDLLQVPEPIIKAAVYCGMDANAIAGPAGEWFRGRVNVMAAGEKWVDFVKEGVDKASALQRIQNLMHISKEETMAFGDNNNDIGMLRCAGESYAVANAREEVKQAAKHLTGSNTQDGVLKVLRTLLEKDC